MGRPKWRPIFYSEGTPAVVFQNKSKLPVAMPPAQLKKKPFSLAVVIAILGLFISPLLHAQTATSKPGRDLTFYVISDTHFGKSPEGDRNEAGLVEKMNKLPGTAYPTETGGIVAKPMGVLHIGDITNKGKMDEWEAFVKDYGLTGKEGLLQWPVYETFGNHDGGPKTPVREGIRERNSKRIGLTAISENKLHYCWSWEGILFINLGIAPGSTENPYDPEHSMKFLEEALTKYAKPGQPLIIMHHFGYDRRSLTWWSEERRTTFLNLIKNKNVIGILHGHAHETSIYQWEGIDIYHPTHFQQKDPLLNGPVTHGFFVFHITGDELAVAERKSDDSWGLMARKKLDLSTRTLR